MMDQPAVSQPEPTSSWSGFIQWFCIGLVLIMALSILAVHLPERLKLLLVYSVVYGMIVGAALTTLAFKLGLSLKWSLLVAILCLTVFGQSLVLYLSHQRYKEATLQQFKMDKTSLMLEHTLAKGEPPSDPEARKQHEEFIKQFESAKQERRDKEQQLLEISSYLQHRISPVARLETPWPQLFWFIELILCCVAAIWASLQVPRPESPASTAEAPPLDKS
ncbi:MAG: hypothetical protein CME31_12215 [Gimesia sp.]|uniref:Uncharacterized protein n=1 Tax=Gimesia maris TaxID=122 RepID=A0A3D3RBS7_9PLAN|nr:hypothetical protein [Gimesia sp.]HCO26273.1 hypothetical protein [Gimesia maris]